MSPDRDNSSVPLLIKGLFHCNFTCFFFSPDVLQIPAQFLIFTRREIKVHVFKKKRKEKKRNNRASVKILISLHQTLYANEVYELMHDPIRIITPPVGSEAGAISRVVP